MRNHTTHKYAAKPSARALIRVDSAIFTFKGRDIQVGDLCTAQMNSLVHHDMTHHAHHAICRKSQKFAISQLSDL